LATLTGYRGTAVLGGDWLRVSADTENLGAACGVRGGSRRAVALLSYRSQTWVDRAIEDDGSREDQGRRRRIPGAGGPRMAAAEERTVMADSVDNRSRA
jgi:hypothetical protein